MVGVFNERSPLASRYNQAACRISQHTVSASTTERPLQSEFFALQKLLRRQTLLLLEYSEVLHCHATGKRSFQVFASEESKTNAETLPQSQNDGSIRGREQPTPTTPKSTIDLARVSHRIDDVQRFSYPKFYAYRYDKVPKEWFGLYTDAQIMQSYCQLLRLMTNYDDKSLKETVLDKIIYVLDDALITAGGQSLVLDGPKWINETFEELKKSGLIESSHKGTDVFDSKELFGRPVIKKAVPRLKDPCSMEAFEQKLNDGDPEPVIIPNLQDSWPAQNERSWKYTSYLMHQTLGGRRLVPIEIGKSYVDAGWGQEIISFKKFLTDYVLGDTGKDVGYLAQHDLFRQIPSLRSDILIPDYCWTDAKGHPTDSTKNKPKLDTPSLNAWFGPANTVTPLHTDGYHNLLCQVVGTKYVRLYHPRCTETLRPRGKEMGVDMSNTSSLDLSMFLDWDKAPSAESQDESSEVERNEISNLAAELEGLDYVEAVLEPGDTLYIPLGWWHYVRSMSISFSVSFWWN